MGEVTIGVLALQGAFAKHIEMLKALGVHAVEVRKPQDLTQCDGLIIPGGESTTMMRQIKYINLTKQLVDFGQSKPIFGTCAGLILMAHEVIADPIRPFDWLEIAVERNAYGRQAESFITDIDVELEGHRHKQFPALFIRAPRIRQQGEHIEVLATFEDEPVLVKQGFHLGATFHPELTQDPSIHEYFINLVKKSHKN